MKNISSINSAQLRKKAKLLKQKILTQSAITHNNYQYRIESLKVEQQKAQQQLSNKIKQLESQLLNISCKYEKDIGKLAKWAQNKNEQLWNNLNIQLIEGEQLKKYLNAQKSALKQMLEDQTQESQPNQAQKIHNIMRKKRLQQILQQVKLKQLQKQVKYLSTHVINSSGLIYVPDNTMTNAQENQLNCKIQIQLNQLERLIGLEVICNSKQVTAAQSHTQNYIEILANQQKRLATAFNLLNKENESICEIQSSIVEFEDVTKEIPLFYTRQAAHINRSNICYSLPAQSSLDILLQNLKLQEYGEVLSNRTCIHEQLASQLKLLRNKIKKIQ